MPHLSNNFFQRILSLSHFNFNPFTLKKGCWVRVYKTGFFFILPLQTGHQWSNTTTTIPLWNDILSATYFFVLGSLATTETPRIPYYHPIIIAWLSLVVIYPQGMIPYQPNNNEVMALREKGHSVGNQLCITQQNSHFLPRTGPINLQIVGNKWEIYRRFYLHGAKMLRFGF